jgi:hypothetical protein
MLSSLQINYRDPRFMRMLQQEAASRPYAALPTRGKATDAFVDQQMRKKAAFDRLGLESKIHEDDMAHKYKLLKFDQKQFKAGEKWAKKNLRQRRTNMLGQIGVGMGTGLLSALEGRRQAKEIAETNRRAQQMHDSIMATNAAIRKAV